MENNTITKNIKGFGTEGVESSLKLMTIQRRSITPNGVEIEIHNIAK